MRTRVLACLAVVALVGGCASSQKFEKQPGLIGQPSWLPLGGEIADPRDLPKAQEQVLSFRPDPRWFPGWAKHTQSIAPDDYVRHLNELTDNNFHRVARVRGARPDTGGADFIFTDPPPYPKTVVDVPIEDQDVRLKLDVEPTKNPDELLFRITMYTKWRPVWREVERNWTNVLPFLFAFYSDDHAVVVAPKKPDMPAGVNYLYRVCLKDKPTMWTVMVNADSLLKLMPTRDPQTADRARSVVIVAAFSERQAVSTRYDTPIIQPNDIVREERYIYPQVCVRSNVVRVRWTGTKWERVP